MRKGGMALALALASALVAWSCGGGGSSSPAPTPVPGGGSSTVTITITGQGNTKAFSPNPATVSAGQTVVFKNNDVTTHHIVLNDGSMTTGDIAAGASSAPQAMGTGTGDALKYHCTIHPGMVGGFNGVTADPPPNCNQAYC